MAHRSQTLSRRGFLQGSAAACIACSVPTIIPGSALGADGAVAPTSAGGVASASRSGLDGAHRLVFVNGSFAAALSDCSRLPVGVVASSMVEALRRTPDVVRDALATLPAAGEQRFGDLNAARATDGAFVSVPAGMISRRARLLMCSATR